MLLTLCSLDLRPWRTADADLCTHAYTERDLFNDDVLLTSQSTKIVKELRAKQQISAGPSDIEVMTIQSVNQVPVCTNVLKTRAPLGMSSTFSNYRFTVLYVANFQRDIELRELRDFGTTVVQQIGSLAAKQPELTSTIQLLFSQVSLHLF